MYGWMYTNFVFYLWPAFLLFWRQPPVVINIQKRLLAWPAAQLTCFTFTKNRENQELVFQNRTSRWHSQRSRKKWYSWRQLRKRTGVTPLGHGAGEARDPTLLWWLANVNQNIGKSVTRFKLQMSGLGGIEGGRGSRRPHLIVMVGLPARGKTYIAKKLARW